MQKFYAKIIAETNKACKSSRECITQPEDEDCKEFLDKKWIVKFITVTRVLDILFLALLVGDLDADKDSIVPTE